jgi:hypothetical protein
LAGSLVGLVALGALATFGIASAMGHARGHTAFVQQCSDSQYPAARDPSNPLMLQTNPGTDPLRGGHYFVDGPRHGAAAGAIAQMLGMDPMGFQDSYSWAALKRRLHTGALADRLAHDRRLARKVQMLEKIADQPEANRFSLYSGGGGPGATFGQVQKILCGNSQADPGSIPIVSTFFLYQAGYCETRGDILGHRSNFDRQINEMVQGIGRRPIVLLLEVDAIGSSRCMEANGALGEWLKDLRFEVDKVSKLPHAVAYVEAGYSDSNPPGYTARALKAADVHKIRGFFTNDTHLNWAIDEVHWGNRVARLVGDTHFVVNTAQDGQGPKLNPNPVTQGNEDLCNPPGRGLGRRLDTSTGYANVDAFMWTHVPGNSSGACRGGPAPGTFWPARAIDLASRANSRLGPRFPSAPY